jgi:uncharacterized membrane protein
MKAFLLIVALIFLILALRFLNIYENPYTAIIFLGLSIFTLFAALNINLLKNNKHNE